MVAAAHDAEIVGAISYANIPPCTPADNDNQHDEDDHDDDLEDLQ